MAVFMSFPMRRKSEAIISRSRRVDKSFRVRANRLPAAVPPRGKKSNSEPKEFHAFRTNRDIVPPFFESLSNNLFRRKEIFCPYQARNFAVSARNQSSGRYGVGTGVPQNSLFPASRAAPVWRPPVRRSRRHRPPPFGLPGRAGSFMRVPLPAGPAGELSRSR